MTTCRSLLRSLVGLGTSLALTQCGSGASEGAAPGGPDASGTPGPGGHPDAGFVFPTLDSCANKCSDDSHSVVDCSGAVVHACSDSQGCANGTCVAACDAAVANKSNVGCEYYAHNPRASSIFIKNGCYALYVSNTWTTPVTVRGDVNGTEIDLTKYTYLPSGGGLSLAMNPVGQGGSIPPGKVGIIFLREGLQDSIVDTICGYGVTVAETDPAAMAWTDPRGSGGRALHVVASAPVVVYDILPFGGGRSEATDATLLLPTSTWGTNYVAITPRPSGYNTTAPAIVVVSSADGTNVTIKPSVDLMGPPPGSPRGVPVTYPLQRGEILRFEQKTDLLGSILSSNNPIGVWGEQGTIDIESGPTLLGWGDGAHEQIPPIRAFGSEYVYARYRNRVDGQDETPPTRITGAVDGTVLTYDPSPMGAMPTVNSGESFEVRSSGPFVVRSQDDKHPFYVATYMTGGGAFGGSGDPEFVNVVPSGQYLSKYPFFTDPTYPETNLVFIRKKGKDGAFHDVSLDCGGMLSDWRPVGSGGAYEWTLRDLVRHNFEGQNGCDNGAHEARSDGPFTLTIWGWGTAETGDRGTPGYSQAVSYAYPAGASVQSINSVDVPPR